MDLIFRSPSNLFVISLQYLSPLDGWNGKFKRICGRTREHMPNPWPVAWLGTDGQMRPSTVQSMATSGRVSSDLSLHLGYWVAVDAGHWPGQWRTGGAGPASLSRPATPGLDSCGSDQVISHGRPAGRSASLCLALAGWKVGGPVHSRLAVLGDSTRAPGHRKRLL